MRSTTRRSATQAPSITPTRDTTGSTPPLTAPTWWRHADLSESSTSRPTAAPRSTWPRVTSSYTPRDANFNGIDSFTLQSANDGTPVQEQRGHPVDVTVNAVNDAPVLGAIRGTRQSTSNGTSSYRSPRDRLRCRWGHAELQPGQRHERLRSVSHLRGPQRSDHQRVHRRLQLDSNRDTRPGHLPPLRQGSRTTAALSSSDDEEINDQTVNEVNVAPVLDADRQQVGQ